jgi:hypothetical protein
MNVSKRKSCAVKIITILATCLLAGFNIVIVIPNFIRLRYETASNACINNLRQIESAKEQWKIENSKRDGDGVIEADIKPYLANENLSKCPANGTNIIGRIGEDPKCSVGNSAWPNSHVLSGYEDNWWTNFKGAYSILFGLHRVQTPSM